MSQPTMFSCPIEDLRKIRITCRCQTTFLFHLPKQLELALNIAVCDNCGQTYIVTKNETTNKFDIRRNGDIRDKVTRQM
jgi:transcription elongation factor Elf1